MAKTLPPHVQAAFETAKREFFKELKNPQDYDFGQFTSINAVYDFTEKLQAEQHRNGNMRHLRRIKPYLDNLSQFVGVMDTFSQVKADMICLIWGPIKFLLQVRANLDTSLQYLPGISSTLVRSYDKVIDVMGQIGDRLPHFTRYVDLFQSNDNLKSLLAVFFRDVLDFHVTALNFFKSRKWDLFFEAMWPKCANKVNIIMTNIERHTGMITSEVTIASIIEARQAHEAALAKHDHDTQWQQRHDLDTLKQYIAPKLYDKQLEDLLGIAGPNFGKWLDNCDEFKKWLDISNSSDRLLWVEGIPGAGKTVLTSSIIARCQNVPDTTTVFAFLTYKDPDTSCVKTAQSFLFQLVLDLPNLRPILLQEVEQAQRKAVGSVSFNRTLITKLFNVCGPSFIVVDGLDELDARERSELLRMLLDFLQDCNELKILVSCRSEDDIVRILAPKASSLQVHALNYDDVKTFIEVTGTAWLDASNFAATVSAEISALLQDLAPRSKGMMLYAKLVLESLRYLSNLEDIRQELHDLPDGLDQAYGRVLIHITESIHPRSRSQVKRILGWIAAAQTPLRLRELEDALSIRYGDTEFKVTQRNSFNIPLLCGPIIELQGDFLHFVHFTAKEYLVGQQSDFYLNMAETHLEISRICMTYLAFDCMQAEENDIIKKHLIAGDYVLFYFAATQWIKHIRLYAQNPTTSSDTEILRQELDDFLDRVQWQDTPAVVDSRLLPLTRFKALLPHSNEACKTLASEEQAWLYELPFHALLGDSTNDGENKSPLNIFATYQSFFSIMQATLCTETAHAAGCSCTELQSSYGSGLYKCDRIGCPWHRTGFQSYVQLSKHILDHARAFKCTDSSCQFHTIGFKTENDMRKHLRQRHTVEKQSAIPTGSQLTHVNLEADVLEALLERAVLQHDQITIEQLLNKATESVRHRLYGLAIARSPPEIVATFIYLGLPVYEEIRSPGSLRDTSIAFIAIQAENVAVTSFLLAYHRDIFAFKHQNLKYVYYNVFKQRPDICLETLELFIEYDMKPSVPVEISQLLRNKGRDDSRFIETIELLRRENIPMQKISTCWLALAEGSCSIEIARYILRQGGDPKLATRGHRPPLLVACQRKDEKAAILIKFLFENGADPEQEFRGARAADQVGAKEIQKWLGVTWDELVESTKDKRKPQQRLVLWSRSGAPVPSDSHPDHGTFKTDNAVFNPVLYMKFPSETSS